MSSARVKLPLFLFGCLETSDSFSDVQILRLAVYCTVCLVIQKVYLNFWTICVDVLIIWGGGLFRVLLSKLSMQPCSLSVLLSRLSVRKSIYISIVWQAVWTRCHDIQIICLTFSTNSLSGQAVYLDIQKTLVRPSNSGGQQTCNFQHRSGLDDNALLYEYYY